MATIYWGGIESATGANDGNWNTLANWYSNPGAPGGPCCPCIPATPATQLPQPGDTVVLYGFQTTGIQNILTGPTGGFSGTITTPITKVTITAGSYSGSVQAQISGGTYTGAVTVFNSISGGTFSNTVTNAGSSISNGTFNGTVAVTAGGASFSGGSFNSTVSISPASGTITISGGTFVSITKTGSGTYPTMVITGGTYSPTATVTLNSAGQVVSTAIPADPGFKFGGGTYSPTLNVSGNVYPATSTVKSGTTYGPTGANYTGALVAKGGASVVYL